MSGRRIRVHGPLRRNHRLSDVLLFLVVGSVCLALLAFILAPL